MRYIMYNPLANNKRGFDNAQKVKALAPNEEYTFLDITETLDLKSFFASLSETDMFILCGGDGTLNRFANYIGNDIPNFDIHYFPTGSGNDFMNDISQNEKDILPTINKYLIDLPVVTVNGKDYRVINGVGFGIDGYCCEEGDAVQRKNSKPVNYTAIALRGLLWKYKPTSARVTVDGVTTEYKKVWMVPTMNGRFFGGGMKVMPLQNRLNSEHSISGLVAFKSSRLKLLLNFPKIFKGNHMNLSIVSPFTCHEVTVEFDSPRALQIDGETIQNVSSYTMRSSVAIKKAFELKSEIAAV